MIRHIFKMIWNERKSNVLIFLEFIIVFCVFWFCSDYLYYIGTRSLEPLGYDIRHTYMIQMGVNYGIEEAKDDRYDNTMLLKSRLESYPGVEAVSLSRAAIPFGGSRTSQGRVINNDSISYNASIRRVSSEYFGVFNMHFDQGRPFTDVEVISEERVAVISPNRDGNFGSDDNPGVPVSEVRTFRKDTKDERPYTVIGITEKQKRSTFEGYEATVFEPMTRSQYEIKQCEIAIRINPSVEEGFKERFKQDIKEQLAIGPYSLSGIYSLKERQEQMDNYATADNIKSVLAITVFLLINIFLGIIGTFWSRTETRRSEIGLRLALGSSKRKIQWQMFIEMFILLFIASIIGVYICVNLGESDLLQAIGIPLADYHRAGFGSGHYFLNYGITFLFLLIISGFAVWYPSKLASKVQPAQTLRAE